MGYDTRFEGAFKLNIPLDPTTTKLINGLNRTRRMKRDLTKLGMTEEEAAGYGIEGELYCPPEENFAGQDHDASVLDHNNPPSTQPGLWCQWCYNEKEQCIKWDEGEKFYNYIEWLRYLIDKILNPMF